MPLPVEAMPSWLWLPEISALAAGASFDLAPEAAHHARRVCRARLGDRLTATDGRGRVALLTLESEAPPRVRIAELRSVPRGRMAWVLCGAPEDGRGDWLVEKLAELGVTTFQPLVCARHPWRRVNAERWRRLAVAATCQARRAWVMEVLEPRSLDAALELLPAGALRELAEASGASPGPPPPAATCGVAAIGPAPGDAGGAGRVAGGQLRAVRCGSPRRGCGPRPRLWRGPRGGREPMTWELIRAQLDEVCSEF